MLNSPVLDLVILLSFTYFVGSLLVSAINEMVAGALRLRPKQLAQSINNLFFDNDWQSFVDEKLLKSPHIQSLMKAKDRYPAYIPAKSFVQALIGEIGAENYTPERLQTALEAQTELPSGLKKVLSDLLAQSGNDLKEFEESVGEFYDHAMDRAGGVYKVAMRRFLLLFGFIIAVVMNIDTIGITRTEMADKNKLNQTVDNIVSELPYIKRNTDSSYAINIVVGDKKVSIHQDIKRAVLDTTNIDSTKSDKRPDCKNCNVKKLADMQIVLQSGSDYRFGYESGDDFLNQWGSSFDKFIIKLIGIILSTIALQLGSNFWFDLLNKAVNLRAAGKKPDITKEKASKK